MKEIIEPKQIHVTPERVMYQTKDGKVFYKKQQALDHEKDLAIDEIVSKMKAVVLDIYTFDYWLFISSQEELEAVEWHYKAHNIYGELKVGTWFYPRWEDETDCAYGYYEIYTLDYVRSQFDMIK